MIVAIIATTSAVALGLALNASRAQITGLGRELNKKIIRVRKLEEEVLFYKASTNAEKDKCQTWEQRGMIAERDLGTALQRLFAHEEQKAKVREQNRINKQLSRARKKAGNA